MKFNFLINLVNPVNSTNPRVLLNMQQVTIIFTVNESLFEDIPVGVMFSSNCTTNLTMVYSNPVIIAINVTGGSSIAIGRCHYTVQLVKGNSQKIGFPINGYFVIQGISLTKF